MKTKVFYFLLIPFLLAGCNNSQNDNGNSQKQEENYLIKEDTSIDFLCMVNDSYKAELQRMINDFEKEEPHVKVRLYNPLGSGDYAAIERVIVSGFFKEDYPDIAQCYPDNVVKYIAQGYAVNLDEYLNNETYGLVGEDASDYISSFLNEGKQYSTKGTYSLPFCKSTELLYYNADVLLGLDLSGIDTSINNGQPLTASYLDDLTWEELFEKLCPALKALNDSLDADHKIYVDDTAGGIFTYDSDENFFITLANQYEYGYTSLDENGKGSIDFNNPEMRNLLKKLYYARQNKYLQTKGTYLDYVSELFVEQKSLLTIGSTAGLTYLYNKNNPFSIGVAKIPHPEGKDYSSINQGPSVCLLDHDNPNRALASFLLWKHITNKKNSSAWSLKTGYMGIRNSSYETDEYKAAINIGEDADKLEIATADNLKKIANVREQTFNTAVFKGSGDARTNVGNLLSEILLNEDKVDLSTEEKLEAFVEEKFALCEQATKAKLN